MGHRLTTFHWLFGIVIMLTIPCLALSNSQAPGTNLRPILYDYEARNYTQETYFAAMNADETNWTPEAIELPTIANYVVGNLKQDIVTHTSIQEAVNDAVLSNSSDRQYIRILPGIYRETVYIPYTDVPITLYGNESPEDVHIVLEMSAKMKGPSYAQLVNPNKSRYGPNRPAFDIYQKCKRRCNGIGSSCSAVVQTLNPNLQVFGLTVENLAKDAQAIAIYVNADRSHLENVRILGHQDTFRAGDNSERIYVANSYISGDVDFVYGTGRLVIKNSELHSRADRHGTAHILAPNTNEEVKYGFLVTNCNLTSDEKYHKTKHAGFGRPWDSTDTANGQAVIRDSNIDMGYNLTSPWVKMSSDAPYRGNINSNRDLNDPNFNRLWDYNNVEV